MKPRRSDAPKQRFPRQLPTISRLAALVALIPCVPAHAMTGGGLDGLNGWAVFGGISLVLALGLYLQSTRRRMS